MQFFTVSTRSRRSGDHTCFTSSPTFGVLALAYGHSFESTALQLMGGRYAEEVIGYVELGFADRVSNVPGLAKFDPAPTAPYSPARLVASIRLANERMNAEHGGTIDSVATSLTACVVGEGAVTLVAAGPDATAWRVRDAAWEPLVGRGAVDAPWIGRAREIGVTVKRVEWRPGDVVGLGMADGAVVDALTAAGGGFDRALASIAASPGWAGLRFAGVRNDG